jgi:multidrug efflux pump subunit AcrA (membrane-fusion protein)
MRQFKQILIGSAILATIVVSCGKTKPAASNPEKIVAVSTSRVTLAGETLLLRYSGTIEASQTIPLSFQTTGTVQKVYAEIGDVVKKGQLLATVDNADMHNIYNAALAKYLQAKDAWDRLKLVHDQGSLPEIKWVEMDTNLEQAKSSLEIAKNNLEKCNMRAPAYGIIGRRNIEPGQSVLGSSLSPIELVHIEIVNLKISVPENEISKIAKGQKASFLVSALDGKQFDGMVNNVSPVADVISRTYTVKITVKNPQLELKPGMVCDVTLNLDRKTASMLIPYKAVSKDSEGNAFVFVVSDDGKRVKKQNITVGSYHESGIEVLGGLAPDQQIVVGGKEKLSDNSLISLQL